MESKLDFAAIICILYISLGNSFPPCCCYTATDDEYRNILFKEPVPNKAIKNHVIKSVEVLNEGSCRVMCYMEPNCVSINVGPLEGGKHKCELNNATGENKFTFLLENKPGHTYLAIQNPCSNSPCLNNGTCQAGFTSKGFRCLCRNGITGSNCNQAPGNCAEVYRSGGKRDGVYTIKPDHLSAFEVFCDQTTAGGGWTVFQKRMDGSVDFYLNWNDYKHGFGNLNGEFWLGLEKIHRLTSDNNNMLRVDFEENIVVYAAYNMFGVMSENDKYKLILGSYSGTAGDSLQSHSGQQFSTKDQDNDKWSDNCAVRHHGAWWYNSCLGSSLNGKYYQSHHAPNSDGIIWYAWKGYNNSLKRTEMKIRPPDF